MEINEIKTVKLEPGEILVIKSKMALSEQEFQYLLRTTKDALARAGYTNEVLIIDNDFELEKIANA